MISLIQEQINDFFENFDQIFVDSNPKLISWEYEILLGILELNLIVTFS